MADMKEMTRSEIRRALLARRGAIAQLAVSLSVSPVTVSLVLRGKSKSQRILDAALRKAKELQSEQAA